MNFSARVYHLSSPTRQAKASYAEREQQKGEFRLRKRLAKLTEQANPKMPDAQAQTPNAAGDVSAHVPGDSDGGQAAAMVSREDWLDARILVRSLEAEGYFFDMSPDEIEIIEALALKRVQGQLSGDEWRSVLSSLKERRRLRMGGAR